MYFPNFRKSVIFDVCGAFENLRFSMQRNRAVEKCIAFFYASKIVDF